MDSYLLSHLFVRQLELAYTKQRLPEIILPVPLAPARLFRRGYNQSAGIARQLGQELNIPVNYHLLSRKLNTRPQTGLNRTARAKNLHNAFQVDKPIKYTCVALVDDVMTTGATLQSLAQCLLSAGVEEVHVWVLARTPQ
ncbi:MAG: ComF family protein [Pseudomonadales bacterium]|nr:ComF family protein [Pseudomonadales bacterium]